MRENNRYVVWFMLVIRLILFISIQSLFAYVFHLNGKNQPWEESMRWWPIAVFVTNIVCLFLLIHLFAREGQSYFGLFKLNRKTLKGDLKTLLIVLIALGPVAFVPNVLLGMLLFNDPMIATELLIRPLSTKVAIVSGGLFAITQGIVEIPVYFSYVMDRLKKKGLSTWMQIGIPSLFLGLQHIGVPLILDINYLLWRGLMYLPFALLLGIVLYKKPRMLPYLAITHIAMDLSFAIMLVTESI